MGAKTIPIPSYLQPSPFKRTNLGGAPVAAVVILTPGTLYEYTYKTGEVVEFKHDILKLEPSGDYAVHGEIYHTTRKGLVVAPRVSQRIAALKSFEASRLKIVIRPTRTAHAVDLSNAGAPSRPRPGPHAGDCEPVNVGFMHTRFVCRLCDKDLGNGDTKRRAVGVRE